MIAGHFHAYQKCEPRDGIEYYILGAAGGYLHKPELAGGFHHFCLLSIRSDRFDMAIVKLGAVEDFSVDDAQHVEQWWTFEVDGITAGGIWDRVDLRDGKVIVIDYKTGARKPMAMDPQTLLYLAAAHDLWPELEVKLEFWWLKTGRKSSETWTPRLDFIARELIKAAWAIVEAQDFRQEIGSACRFCNFKGMCGVWQEFEQGKAWLVKPGFGAK